MKQIVIDELRPSDYKALKSYLNDQFGAAAIDGIYWLPLDPGTLTAKQREHADCQPFYFAVELEADRISFEFLVRTKHRVRCSCMAYATRDQCDWLMRKVDSVFQQLDIQY
jgi:hypothetical protein